MALERCKEIILTIKLISNTDLQAVVRQNRTGNFTDIYFGACVYVSNHNMSIPYNVGSREVLTIMRYFLTPISTHTELEPSTKVEGCRYGSGT